MSKTVNYIGKIKEIKIPKNINLVEDVVKYLSEKFNISIEDFEMKNGDILSSSAVKPLPLGGGYKAV